MYKLDSLMSTNLNTMNINGTVNAETEFKIEFRTSSRLSRQYEYENNLKKAKSIGDFNETVNETDQNKENECSGPRYNYGLVLESKHLSGLNVNNPADKRRGVKMGTRAFVNNNCKTGLSRSMEAVNAISKEYLEEMSLQSISLHCSSTSVSRSSPTGKCTPNEAYIIGKLILFNFFLLLLSIQDI